MIETINFKLNGKTTNLSVDRERSLLWILRTELSLSGAKYGCGEGLCGSCTVVVNRKAVRSCQYPVKKVNGKEVLTIEGLTKENKLHPIQQAFVKHDALQCGYCTPGMILNAYSLLLENPSPSRKEIIENMEDNLCRCGSHIRIVQAIQFAAKQMKGGMEQ